MGLGIMVVGFRYGSWDHGCRFSTIVCDLIILSFLLIFFTQGLYIKADFLRSKFIVLSNELGKKEHTKRVFIDNMFE